MRLEGTRQLDSLGIVVTRSDGTIKDTRFVKKTIFGTWEFLPNHLYLYLINKRVIQPNTWKLPVFGTWHLIKD